MYSPESRIIKAQHYYDERDERIRVESFKCRFTGEHSDHMIEYSHQSWKCDCEEFRLTFVCAHVMAIEKVMGEGVTPALMPTPNR